MSNLLVVSRRRGLPVLTTVGMAGIGLALYQLTSLELGPAERDFGVNLNLDALSVQDVTQPLDKADAALGQVMVGLHSTPAPAQGARRASTAGAAVTSGRTSPAIPSSTVRALLAPPASGQTPVRPSSGGTPPAQPASTASSPTAPEPIIGRCQNSSTGLSSGTSPSKGWRGLTDSRCLEAGQPD